MRTSSFRRFLSAAMVLSLSVGTALSVSPSVSFAKSAKTNAYQSTGRPEVVPDQLIVKLKNAPAAGPELSAKHLLSAKGLKVKNVRSLLKKNAKIAGHAKMEALADRLFIVNLEPGSDPLAAMRSLKGDARIAYAEPNYRVHTLAVPNDPMFSQQWDLNNTGQTFGVPDADIDAPEAWSVTHDTPVVVGIIDTGVDYTHPELADNMWRNPGEIPGNGIDDEGNGYIDDVYGWDFANNDNDPMDDFGHGTHCAGTIGAKGNNGVGIVGINWNAKIAAIKFLDSGGGGTYEAAVESVLYANMMGFKITSNSWGGGGFSQALYDAVAAANDQGDLFVAAAGNDGSDADVFPMYPSAFDLPNVISVAATNDSDQLAGFSNYGATSVDLAAPGQDTLSTVPTGSCALCDPSGYMFLSGTSMATPHVSGAAALLWGQNPSLTAAQVKVKILGSTDALESLSGKMVSEGRLNLYNLFDNDTTAPAAVTDLSVAASAHNALTITWTATGDDGTTGKASRYDVRYSSSPITEANFVSAAQVTGEPKPADPGTTQTMSFKGLEPETNYYVAMKVIDNMGNVSLLSDVAQATTLVAKNVFEDTMEHGTNGWTVDGVIFSVDTSLWHLSTRRALSPVTSWYYGREDTGNYDTGSRNIGSIISPVISLDSLENSELVFSQFVDTENSPYYDIAQVQIRPEGSTTWQILLQTGTTNGAFRTEKIDLSAFDNQPIQIRFFFDSVDAYLQREGWYVDDVTIRGTPPPNTPPTANAGSDKTGTLGQTLTFDGSLSSDAEGPIKSFKWNFGDGATATTAVAKHAYKTFGSFTATLTVTDMGDLQSSDTAVVTIIDTVKITSAVYQTGKKTLTVKATTNAKSADLTLVGFPGATKKKIAGGFEFTVTKLATKPATVTVTSSLGGSATAPVSSAR